METWYGLAAGPHTQLQNISVRDGHHSRGTKAKVTWASQNLPSDWAAGHYIMGPMDAHGQDGGPVGEGCLTEDLGPSSHTARRPFSGVNLEGSERISHSTRSPPNFRARGDRPLTPVLSRHRGETEAQRVEVACPRPHK